MTNLTFYGGVNEIGGNKILLQDKDTKVFLDFGKSFSRRAAYFEEYLNPRTSNGIVDFLTMGLIPDIKGVYRDDLMVMTGRKPQEPDIDAKILYPIHTEYLDTFNKVSKNVVLVDEGKEGRIEILPENHDLIMKCLSYAYDVSS